MNYVFIPIPRNASGSISLAIKDKKNFYHYEKSHSMVPYKTPAHACNSEKDSSWHYAYRVLAEQNIDWSMCKKFSVIRNPWSRAVSMFHHNHANILEQDFGTFLKTIPSLMLGKVFCDFNTKVVSIPSFSELNSAKIAEYEKKLSYHPDIAIIQHHVIPQALHIFDNNHNSVLDYVIRFENIQENFNDFLVSESLAPIKLKHKNYSRASDLGTSKSYLKDYKDFYTEQWMIDFISMIYGQDIKMGNYTF